MGFLTERSVRGPALLAWVCLAACGWLGPDPRPTTTADGVEIKDAPAKEHPRDEMKAPEPDAEGWLPTPFTAAQIREAMPVGAFRDFRNTHADGSVEQSHFEVVEAGAERATLAYEVRDSDGELSAPPQRGEESWEELRLHARFPAADTRWMGVEEVEVPAGSFVAHHYEVLKVDPGRPATVWDYWFASRLPGPPVKFTVKQGGLLLVTSELSSFGPTRTR